MVRLDDGFSTTIGFGTSSFTLFEKTVQPPGFDGGGEIDTTNMQNTAWRTRQPKQLITLTESTLTVAFDTAIFGECISSINVNQLITITFPDTATLAFWGWMNTFEPDEFAEGEQPEAECGIMCSNEDNTPSEVAPVYTAPGP